MRGALDACVLSECCIACVAHEGQQLVQQGATLSTLLKCEHCCDLFLKEHTMCPTRLHTKHALFRRNTRDGQLVPLYTPECADFGSQGGTDLSCTPAWWRSCGTGRHNTSGRWGRRPACSCTRALQTPGPSRLFRLFPVGITPNGYSNAGNTRETRQETCMSYL